MSKIVQNKNFSQPAISNIAKEFLMLTFNKICLVRFF